MNGKVDLIPGQPNVLRLRANRPGDYRVWLNQQLQAAQAAGDQEKAGEQQFMGKACSLCHILRGTDAQGVLGPDLTHVVNCASIAAGMLVNHTANLSAWVTYATSTRTRTLSIACACSGSFPPRRPSRAVAPELPTGHRWAQDGGMDDPFDLARFIDAQNPVYQQSCAELRRGQKTSHWLWFIFPQLRGLGHSAMAVRYGIGSRAEAEAYLSHAILGPRLRDSTRLVNRIEGRPVSRIFGYPDDLKFHSSMTLFSIVAPGEDVFQEALRKYFQGDPDALTVRMLSRL